MSFAAPAVEVRRPCCDSSVSGSDGARCPSPRLPFVLEANRLRGKEKAMKYMLLIHQGTTPLPGSSEWERLSEAEQTAVYSDYKGINETAGVTSGVQMQP